MSAPLSEKSGRYSVQVEALITQGETTYLRSRSDTGQRVGEPGSDRFRVILDAAASLQLGLGENGLTVGRVKLVDAREAVVTAVVTPGPQAPDWLPERSEYLLFSGDATQAANTPERYIPLDGMASADEPPATGTAPLDRLAIAIGRSVARANAILARSQAEAGVALVSGITMRLAADRVELSQGRVVVTLAPPGTSGETQFIEFTMTTVPGAAEEEEPSELDKLSNISAPNVEPQTNDPAAGPAGGDQTGAQAGAQSPAGPNRVTVQTPSGVFRTRGQTNQARRRSGS